MQTSEELDTDKSSFEIAVFIDHVINRDKSKNLDLSKIKISYTDDNN